MKELSGDRDIPLSFFARSRKKTTAQKSGGIKELLFTLEE